MIRMVWWAAALFLAGGCTLGVVCGCVAEWLEMRGDYAEGVEEGRRLADPGEFSGEWDELDDVPADWLENLDAQAAIARARELVPE